MTSSPVPSPSVLQASKASKPFGYGYPALQPGYQNATPPTPVQPSNPGHHPGFQHYPQACIFNLKNTSLSKLMGKRFAMLYTVILRIQAAPF